ncbi:TPA: type III-A CRISPR-associated protein Csm2 [Candidatus Poribacteria bacterium]|nr:type III-A CRISPR-associated protein Csm2 [Candidatus Poribacteria bacterium]
MNRSDELLSEFQSMIQHPKPLSDLLDPEKFAPADGIADRLAEEFGRSLNTTQLRKSFNKIKAMDRRLKPFKDEDELSREIKGEISLLIPELAYAAGRGTIPYEFYNLMKMLLDGNKLRTVGDFRRLVQFLTALLAYHKLYEKRGE